MCLPKVEDLNRELKEMRALVEELHSALRTEQIEKSTLQVKSYWYTSGIAGAFLYGILSSRFHS